MGDQIWIGFDPREASAFAVTKSSIRRRLTQLVPIHGLILRDLQVKGLYTRPTSWRQVSAVDLVMWDDISDAPMATEFSNSRFLVPVVQKTGWGLFMDCDMLVRHNLVRLFEKLDSKYAVYCVKHDYQPKTAVKMDNQVQTTYNRKLWSSFCVFNCSHPANNALTVEVVNTLPGRDLHRFCWLRDDQIGELGEEWNWIPGHSSENIDPKCVHFTEGVPSFKGYEDVSFADEWREELRVWAR